MSYDYDLLVIGTGPAGQKAAIQAAKLRRRVAIVDRAGMLGGVCLMTGTIPSKGVREAILYLTGFSQRGIYGQGYHLKDTITIDDLRLRTGQIVEREQAVIRDQLVRNHVTILEGTASFLDPHTVAISASERDDKRVSADKIVIATGSAPAHPPGIAFDGRTILDSDQMLLIPELPRTLLVVGAGVIGIEYASMFAALGVHVTVVEKHHTMLEFCDAEVVEGLRYHLRDLSVIFRFGETVTRVEQHEGGALTFLDSGKRIATDAVFYSAGRQGAVDGLGLENVGLEADERGRIAVGAHYRTAVEHVYATGDVIGFPSLASVSAEQGRIASCDAFGVEVAAMNELLPFGIYAIPELSFVGRTEAELTDADRPYEVGISRYRELARGQIIGDAHGMLKLLVCPDTHRLLGVHALGAGATELVHIGHAIMGLGGTVDFVVNTVFNYPTLAEAYKVAALDAVNKLREVSRLSAV